MDEITPDSSVKFDPKVAEELVRYGRMLVARGYIHNGLGGIVIRVPHDNYPDGVAYVKPMGLSMEELTVDHVVITDIPEGRLLYGTSPPAPGHQLNREILRLRPEINSVIHVHDDHVIVYLAAGLGDFVHCSLESPSVLGLPPYVVNHHIDIEENVAPVKEFVQKTNAILMKRHGITTLGRSVSEAYHRLNTVTAEIRRVVMIETLAIAKGTKATYLSEDEAQHMYRRSRAQNRPYFENNRLKRSAPA